AAASAATAAGRRRGEHRVQLVDEVSLEGAGGDEAIDELDLLVRLGGGQVRIQLGDGGDASGEVEREAAEDGGVVGERGGLDRLFLQREVDVVINGLGDGLRGRQEVVGERGAGEQERGQGGQGEAEQLHRSILSADRSGRAGGEPAAG